VPRGLRIIALAASLATPVFAQATKAQSPSSDAEQTLRQLSSEWARIPLTRDVSLLEGIWAPDFTYVTPDGSVFGKEKGIADVSKMSGNVSSAENSNLKIRVYGGSAAVVTGDYHVTGRDQDGKSFDARSRFTNVWVLRNGVWQCVSGHSSVLASK
jgi:ketosteroid isomerase-like protein